MDGEEPLDLKEQPPMSIRPGAAATALLVVLALGPVAPAVTASAAPAERGRTVPSGIGCTVFPADDIWNTDISTLPVNSHNAAWMSSMNAGSMKLHPDFGGPPYGMPYAVVPDSHPKVKVKFHWGSESDKGPYPFGKDIPIENGSDRHALMVDGDTCVLYELFAARWHHGTPTAGSGAIFDLGSNALRHDGWTSADAAGLPIFPGLVRWDEVQDGFIGHAIRFTADLTDCHHLWPARHDAGTCNDTYPPMGARFRLKGSFDISHFSANAQVILLAMQHYGFILADNGSNWYFQGTEDKHWTDSLLDELKSIPASQFEAVDESACMVNKDSGQADCP
jgi:hypothetical protein